MIRAQQRRMNMISDLDGDWKWLHAAEAARPLRAGVEHVTGSEWFGLGIFDRGRERVSASSRQG